MISGNSTGARRDTPDTSAHSDEVDLLEAIRAELERLGGRAAIRRTATGSPFLLALGTHALLKEEITVRRRAGRVHALWSWNEELPPDPREAAALIQRVITTAI